MNRGKWKDLPAVKYISVVRVNESSKGYQVSSRMFVESSKGEKAFNLNLIVDDKIRFITLSRMKKEIGLKTAMEIGNLFDLKVLDLSTPEKKWIR
jgi:hypothetical protein